LEIPNIERFIQRDEVLLMMARDRHLSSCQELLYLLQEILQRPALKKPTKNRNPSNLKFDLWMMSRIREVGSWIVGPFTKTRWNFVKDMNRARDMAQQGNYQAVADTFNLLIRSLVFKNAQFHLEQVITKVSVVTHSLEESDSASTDQFAINRVGYLAEEVNGLRQRFQLVLNDTGFRHRPKARLIQCLVEAERAIGSWDWPKAKSLLDEATSIL
jgi:hypothetical protein